MSKKGIVRVGKKPTPKPSVPAKSSGPKALPKSSGPKAIVKPSVPAPLPKPAPPKFSVSNLQSRIRLIWLRSQASLYARLPLVVIREVSLYFSDPPLFVLLYYSSVSSFDVSRGQTAKTKKVVLNTRLTCSNSSYVVLDRTAVLCCGGNGIPHTDIASKMGAASSQVFTVHITNGTVDSLAAMSIARERCGLIVHNQVAYVFGGTDRRFYGSIAPCATTCESMALASNAWGRLDDMNVAKWSFNPCLWKREIYLCDNFTAEIFNTENRSFRAIQAEFAKTRDACTYVWGDQLVLVTAEWVIRLGYRDGDLEVGRKQQKAVSPASQSLPAVWESRVYWFSYGELIVANAETGARVGTKKRR